MILFHCREIRILIISSIEFDSRNVTAGSLFVAVKGYNTDGHDFISAAVTAGASAIICETLPEEHG